MLSWSFPYTMDTYVYVWEPETDAKKWFSGAGVPCACETSNAVETGESNSVSTYPEKGFFVVLSLVGPLQGCIVRD